MENESAWLPGMEATRRTPSSLGYGIICLRKLPPTSSIDPAGAARQISSANLHHRTARVDRASESESGAWGGEFVLPRHVFLADQGEMEWLTYFRKRAFLK